jgi:hypothetical protein
MTLQMKTTRRRRGRRTRRAASGPSTSGATGPKKSPVTRGQTPARAAASGAADAAPTSRPPSPLTLPTGYGESRLVLMDVDPFKVFVYWEVTLRDQRAAKRRLGRAAASATWVLRFHDVTSGSDESGAHRWFDVTVDLAPGNWYVDLWAAAKFYWVELGPRGANGRFIPVCRSNLIQTPPSDVSARYEARMLRVEGDFDRVALAEAPTAIDAARESSASRSTPTAEPSAEAEPPIGAEPLAEGVEAAHGDLHLETEKASERDSGTATAPESAPLALNDAEIWRRYEALAGTSHRVSDAQMAWAAPVTTAPEMPFVDEPEARRHPDDPFTNPERPGQDGKPARSGDGPIPSETLIAEASGTVSSSSPARAPEPALAVTLNVEVMISGRAQPGQTIEVNGHQVDVSPEGAFSVRLALPLTKP